MGYGGPAEPAPRRRLATLFSRACRRAASIIEAGPLLWRDACNGGACVHACTQAPAYAGKRGPHACMRRTVAWGAGLGHRERARLHLCEHLGRVLFDAFGVGDVARIDAYQFGGTL